nr:chorismate mutase [Brachyspira sp. G79]
MLAEELQELRKEIDRIDKQIVNLIDERMKVSLKVGETKKNIMPLYLIQKEKRKLYQKK